MKKAPRFPIGTSDFRQFRQEELVYVDKSLFIEQVIENSARVLLLPRPRRFGKTLNLSMLRYFFEKPKASKEVEDRRKLFSGLQIEQSKEAWAYFQKYPVHVPYSQRCQNEFLERGLASDCRGSGCFV